MSNNQIVKYKADDGVNITLTPQIVFKYITQSNPYVTSDEVGLFMMVCQSTKLNPFVRDAYLVKYDAAKPAQIVTGKDFFVKRANKNPHCRYYNAGIIAIDNKTKKEDFKTGTYYNENSETLDGAWAITYRNDKDKPFKITIKLAEYSSGQSTWKKMPATMIRKVALVQVLREAYPEDFRGLYSSEEILKDTEKLDTENIDIEKVLKEEFGNNNGSSDVTEAEFGEVKEEETNNTNESETTEIKVDTEPQEEVKQETKDEKPKNNLFDEKITLEQAQNLYIVAKGYKEKAKEIMHDYGYESSKDIILKDYSKIANDIIKVVHEIENNTKEEKTDTTN